METSNVIQQDLQPTLNETQTNTSFQHSSKFVASPSNQISYINGRLVKYFHIACSLNSKLLRLEGEAERKHSTFSFCLTKFKNFVIIRLQYSFQLLVSSTQAIVSAYHHRSETHPTSQCHYSSTTYTAICGLSTISYNNFTSNIYNGFV